MGTVTNGTVVSTNNAQPSAPLHAVRISFKMSNSYAGPIGDEIDIPALVGKGVVEGDIMEVDLDPDNTNWYLWSRAEGTASTVKAFVNSSGAEVANATDLSGVTVTGTVWHV